MDPRDLILREFGQTIIERQLPPASFPCPQCGGRIHVDWSTTATLVGELVSACIHCRTCNVTVECDGLDVPPSWRDASGTLLPSEEE